MAEWKYWRKLVNIGDNNVLGLCSNLQSCSAGRPSLALNQ